MEKFKEIVRKFVINKYPNHDAEDIIGKFGELVLLESFDEAVEKFKQESDKDNFQKLYLAGDIEKLESLSKKHGFSYVELIEDKVKSLFLEFFG